MTTTTNCKHQNFYPTAEKRAKVYLTHTVVAGDDPLAVHAASLVRARLAQVVRVAAHPALALVLLPLDCIRKSYILCLLHIQLFWQRPYYTSCRRGVVS